MASSLYLVVAVVPPVGHGSSTHHSAEFDHVIDLPPSVLANPSTPARVIRVDGRGHDVVTGIVGRADPVVLILSVHPVLVPVVGAHDLRATIRPTGMKPKV